MTYLPQAFSLVYTKKTQYFVITLVLSVFIFLFALYLPQKDFVAAILAENTFSFLTKLRLIVGASGSFITNFSLFSQLSIIIISLLFGINGAFLVYYLIRKVAADVASGLSLFGIIGGLFGVGCSACGSVLLSSFIGVAGTVQILGVLPFHGKEFSIFGIGLIMFSILYIAKKIARPPTCSI